jgi:hypothetical protein
MFHPADVAMERGWVGRIEGDEVVHLAAQTLQHVFTGGGTARDHARYPLADVVLLPPLPMPPSVRVFDAAGAFEFANPAAVDGPGAAVSPPDGRIVADAGLAGLVGPEAVVAVSPVARLRAAELSPPKDRDFAIVLGPWFTTLDEVPGAIALRVSNGDTTHAAAADGFDWETARRFAGENTRLRVGDLLLGPPAVVADVGPGPVRLDAGALGRLELAVEAV